MGKEIKEVKSIETVYNGYRFRSRLEARVAVLFDALGIEYQYEPEGFEYKGDYYLPDFYVPNNDPDGGGHTFRDCYVEVKPIRKGFGKEIKKAINVVANGLKKNLIIITEIPNLELEKTHSETTLCNGDCVCKNPTFAMVSPTTIVGLDPDSYFLALYRVTFFDFYPWNRSLKLKGDVYGDIEVENICFSLLDYYEKNDDLLYLKEKFGLAFEREWEEHRLSSLIPYAFSVARQARFEHGQAPNAKDLRQGYEKWALDYINSCKEDEDDD